MEFPWHRSTPGTRCGHECRDAVVRIRWWSFGCIDGDVVARISDRQLIDHRHISDARDRSQLFDESGEELRCASLVGVFVRGESNLRGEQIPCVESGIHGAKRCEAPQQETRSDQQDHGDRHLRDNQAIVESLASSVDSAGARSDVAHDVPVGPPGQRAGVQRATPSLRTPRGRTPTSTTRLPDPRCPVRRAERRRGSTSETQTASTVPSAPAAVAVTIDSVSSWRAIRDEEAPNAARTHSSVRRAAPRASKQAGDVATRDQEHETRPRS